MMSSNGESAGNYSDVLHSDHGVERLEAVITSRRVRTETVVRNGDNVIIIDQTDWEIDNFSRISRSARIRLHVEDARHVARLILAACGDDPAAPEAA